MKITLNELRKIIRNIILENTEGSELRLLKEFSEQYVKLLSSTYEINETFKNLIKSYKDQDKNAIEENMEIIKTYQMIDQPKNIDLAFSLTKKFAQIPIYIFRPENNDQTLENAYKIAKIVFGYIGEKNERKPSDLRPLSFTDTDMNHGIIGKINELTECLNKLTVVGGPTKKTLQEVLTDFPLPLLKKDTRDALEPFFKKLDIFMENKRKRNLLEKRKRLHENLSSEKLSPESKIKILDKIYTPGKNNLIPMWWRFGHEVRALANNDGGDKELKDSVYPDFDQLELKKLCDIMDLLEESSSQNKEEVIEKLKNLINEYDKLEFEHINNLDLKFSGLLIKINSILNK